MPWAAMMSVLRKEQQPEGNESLLFRKIALESEVGMKLLQLQTLCRIQSLIQICFFLISLLLRSSAWEEFLRKSFFSGLDIAWFLLSSLLDQLVCISSVFYRLRFPSGVLPVKLYQTPRRETFHLREHLRLPAYPQDAVPASLFLSSL